VTCSRRTEIFRLGFTLPEVCVALAVFLIGTTALLGGWNFFNREIADERYRLERFYGVVSSMESLITERPSCTDSLLALGHATIRLDRVPGSIPLAWAVVAWDGFSLKRLIRCR
jgi:prepilin-type N-terminal cleavage/methylation domain-containing protein